jgi:hypothetical protein
MSRVVIYGVSGVQTRERYQWKTFEPSKSTIFEDEFGYFSSQWRGLLQASASQADLLHPWTSTTLVTSRNFTNGVGGFFVVEIGGVRPTQVPVSNITWDDAS